KDGGHRVTRVNYKLVGNRIKPKNMGRRPNRITGDELTEMMVQIYNREHPGSDVLIEALANQKDLLLGYAAVKDLEGVEWLGEKTGENSKAMGTTVAMYIDGQIYIVTVTDNRGGRDPQIRKCIRAIADYILHN
ncbi:MAG: serine hydrolase, partial [Okeania sp. SIO2H7]|nr:serine hydrolase [Okeania sp. SIO2H7]